MPTGVIAKLARYILTAGVAAIVDLTGFALVYRLTGQIAASAVVSWLAAAFCNYGLTSIIVFHQSWCWRSCRRFLAGASTGLMINVALTWLAARALGLDPMIAKVAGIGTAFLLNFSINLIWVFPQGRPQPKP